MLTQEAHLPPDRWRVFGMGCFNSSFVLRPFLPELRTRESLGHWSSRSKPPHTSTASAPTNSSYLRPGTNNLPPACVLFSCNTPSATILASTSASRWGWREAGSRGLRSSHLRRAFPKISRLARRPCCFHHGHDGTVVSLVGTHLNLGFRLASEGSGFAVWLDRAWSRRSP